jgi:hypothetical protein
MPVIPGTLEAEIDKITVQGRPQENVSETPCQSISQAEWCSPVIPATCDSYLVGRSLLTSAPAKTWDPI